MVRPLLKRGSTGDDVKLVQMLLMTDGVYGAATEAAVKRFQDEQGNLTTDGKVGPATWRALEALLETQVPAPKPEPVPKPIEPPPIEPEPEPIPPPASVVDARTKMAQAIVNFEARRDDKGRLAVHKLHPEDRGGTYEVAGINDKYHKKEADELVALINAGKYGEAERKVVEFVATYTDVVVNWVTTISAVQSYLRDCAFNRGPTGAMRILQRAAKVKDDGKWGPNTKAAVEATRRTSCSRACVSRASNTNATLRSATSSSIFWKGLVSRWDKALAIAHSFQQPDGDVSMNLLALLPVLLSVLGRGKPNIEIPIKGIVDTIGSMTQQEREEPIEPVDVASRPSRNWPAWDTTLARSTASPDRRRARR